MASMRPSGLAKLYVNDVKAAKDLKEELARRFGVKARSRVRTMAILVNGFKKDIN